MRIQAQLRGLVDDFVGTEVKLENGNVEMTVSRIEIECANRHT
jgi:hypothetical protein